MIVTINKNKDDGDGEEAIIMKTRRSKLCETQKAIWWAWWVCVGDG